MASVIEGLSIVWNSDNQDFNKSVTQINKELRATGTLGREVDKALKLDPGNVDLMNKSLNITTVELEGSREKSIALNREIERLGKLDISELNEDLAKQQKELKASQQQSKELNKELTKLGKTDVNSEEYQKLTKELEDSKKATKETQDSINQLNRDLKALDVTNMAKLEGNAVKANNEVNRLEKKQRDLNDSIKQIPNGEYDQLNKEIDKASNSMEDLSGASSTAGSAVGELGGAVGGTTGQVVSGTSSIVGYSASLASLGPAGMAAGAAIGAVTVAMTYSLEKGKELNAINYELAKSYGDTAPIDEYADTVYGVGKALGDQEQAAQASAAAIKIYGDNIQNSSDQIEATTGVMATADATGMDYATTANYAAQVQKLWNTNLYETEQAMGAAITLSQEYGAKADDLNDTLTEFGPTFVAMGFSMEETFAILEAGLAMGARNTDEVANAINEMNIRIGESAGVTDDFDLALQAVYGDTNLTSEAFNEMMQNDPTGTLKSLTEATYDYALASGDTNEIIKIGGQLMGTYGEEMFAEAINMAVATSGTQAYRDAKAGLNSVSEKAIANAQAEFEAGTISQQQLNDTIAKYGELTIAKALTTEMTATELEQMAIWLENAGYTQEQITLMTDAQTLFTEAKNTNNAALLVEGENLATTTAFLTTYKDTLGLTDEQLAEYNLKLTNAANANSILGSTTEELNTKTMTYLDTLFTQDLATQQFTITTQTAQQANLGLQGTTESLTLAQIASEAATTGNTEALSQAGQQLGFTKDEADQLASSYLTLASDSATAQEKTDALTQAQATLDSSSVSSGAATDALGKSIEDLNWLNAEAARVMGTTTGANEDSTTAIEGGNKAYEEQKKALEDANPKLEKNAEKAKEAARQQEELAKQTQKASDNMSDLNAELDNYNGKSVAPKQVGTVETSTRSVATPQMSPLDTARMGTMSNSRAISGSYATANGFTSVNTNGRVSGLNIPITINGNGSYTSSEINDITSKVTNELRKELSRLL
jgi:hypothetical protein